MKIKKIFYCSFFPAVISYGCINNNGAVQVQVSDSHKRDTVAGIKPSSTFTDTVVINKECVVFFEPDSLQLQSIKDVTDEGVFKASMHEYEYQVKNAANFLKHYYPQLQIIYIKKARYLWFKSSSVNQFIDLNSYDPVGMFVFDAVKKPVLIDMTNVETHVSDYFSTR